MEHSETRDFETSALIRRLDTCIAATRTSYYDQLRPGATESALVAFEVQFSICLPGAFRAFYRWRDGQESDCTANLQGNWKFSSLDEVSESKDLCDGMIGFDFDDPRWWRSAWIPFLANGGGDHLCLDLLAEDGGTPGQVVTFYHDWEHRPINFLSFDAWLTWLVNSMESGTLELL